ncbi:hypothetical protein AJ78_08690 [Emergomyces pasteurianus Ep9510]|uniref:Uncharacterized protein n=1 Tax=Emergomyces pasteurianus Ep9510 TaxID=1447872 RepID=A0A1J9P066_9EURO|nr:hypothetical protein AJ78_08690 [Emergomyces pasteurianus Ep9510]
MSGQKANQHTIVPTVVPASTLVGFQCHREWTSLHSIPTIRFVFNIRFPLDKSPPDANHTCQHATTQKYSDENLPPLLFQLDPPSERSTTIIPNLVENGLEVKGYDGVVIRDFPFLPRYISTRPLAWQLEYWMRLDSRMTYRDIKARMTVRKEILPNDNSLNMRREREARAPLGLSCWTTRRGGVTRTEIERVDKLSLDQVLLNTTMDVLYYDDPVKGRTAVPKCLRARTLTGASPAYYPCDMFLVNERLHVPGPRLAEALALHEQLLEVVAHSDVNDWRELPRDMLPRSWSRSGTDDRATDAAQQKSASRVLAHRRAQGKSIQTKPDLLGPNSRANNNKTHGGRPTGLFSPLQGPSFSMETVHNDQARPTGQANNPSGFSGYKTMGGTEPGTMQIPAAAGFPDGFQMPGMGFGFGGIHHGLPAPEAAFGLTCCFGYQPNPLAASSPGAYKPGYNPFMSTSHRNNPFALHQYQHQRQQLQQQPEQQLVISVTHTTSLNGHHQPGSSAPQGGFPGDSQRAIGQNCSLDYDIECNASTYSPAQTDPSSPVNQVKAEDESYRFNGSGPHSIRLNPDHRLNTDTVTVMQRNDPFRRIQEGSGPFSSFDDFLEDQM